MTKATQVSKSISVNSPIAIFNRMVAISCAITLLGEKLTLVIDSS